MKKLYNSIFPIIALLLIGVTGYSQADVVVVPSVIDGEPLGALNKFIGGDTTATGERVNPERIYKLNRDEIYFLNGTLTANFDLQLIADDSDDPNSKPPIVASGVLADGSVVGVYFACNENASLKNIYLMGTQPTGVGDVAAFVQAFKEGGHYSFDNVQFEWSLFLGLMMLAPDQNIKISNCYFKNLENQTSPWNGRAIDLRDNNMDSLVMVNNTFYNLNSFIVRGQESTINHMRFEHNTVANSVKFPLMWYWQTNAIIRNNLFYNVNSFGESDADAEGQDADGLPFGIVNVTALPSDLGRAESDRVIDVRNNAYFYTEDVTNYWASFPGVQGGSFMNSRTQGFFDDATTYPNLIAENNFNEDPSFINDGDVEGAMVTWMTNLRNEAENTYWGFDEDGDRFSVTLPYVENLAYSNETLLTSSFDGFPVGDLNWFPEQKALWEQLGSEEVVAMAPDTVIVPSMLDGELLGALNKFIGGDTTETGARVNPNRVYQLNRDEIYFLNGTLTANFNLDLFAPTSDDPNSKPPIIASGVLADGSVVGVYFACNENASLKNIYLMGTQPTGVGDVAAFVQAFKEGGHYNFDNVQFEWSLFLGLMMLAPDQNIKITNCYFKNLENQTSPWNGRAIDLRDNNMDSLVMINNSFFNLNSFIVRGQESTINYMRFEHNTVANSVKFPLMWYWQTDAVIKNNLFYNVNSFGESDADAEGQDADGLPFGIVNVTALPSDLGFAEADRIIDVRNNAYFYTEDVTNYWAAFPGVQGGSFMNSRTQGFFDDDTTYPSLRSENNLNEDPAFINDGDVEGAMVTWMTNLRNEAENTYWGFDEDGDRFSVTIPYIENLAYANETLLSGAIGGFPVGDLNWFPEQKSAFEGFTTSVYFEEVPKNFTLAQNAPNPFSEETTIRYTVAKTVDLNIAVYDIGGRRVATLTNSRHTPGEYSINWKGVDASGNRVGSGIYFYQLRSEGSVATGKLMVVRNGQ